MRYLPMPGRWRRRALAGIGLLLFLPVLLAIGLDAVAALVHLVDHLVGLVWPYAVALLLVFAGGYLLRLLYFRRRW
jgi:Mn2+/Fe2+ NRAMP family transporter